MKARYWFALLLVLVVGAIEWMVWRSRGDKTTAGAPSSSAPREEGLQYLKPGDTVPPFEAEVLKNGVIHVDYPPASSTLLLFFSPTCGTCEKNLPMWEQLAAKAKDQARVLSVMVGGDYQVERLFMKRHELSFPVLRFRNREALAKYRPVSVPQTVLVGPAGKVEGVIIGPLSAEQVDRLVSRLKSSRVAP